MALNLAAVGRTLGPFELAYEWKDVVLYALALGTGVDQVDYLLDPEPKVLPTWGVIPATEPVFAALASVGGTLDRLLHSAQRTEQIRPFPPAAVVHTTARVVGIWDMRVGAL
ncbi:MAG TPA: hypothetical protein VG963_04310, partial [Polyangiaceae bacterium]|nr:hypothetical protein [Polyangiaceae bacterium]